MRNVRVVARLDVKGDKVINTVHLEGLRVCGDPNILALDYYRQGADEILIIDQVASLYKRNHLLELTSGFAKNIFIPVTVGGGIRSVDDARILLRSGADKIAVNSAAIERPQLIDELASEFGDQCIVVSIQAKENGSRSWEALCDGGRERTGKSVVDWASEAVSRGAGELLVTSIDRDGTRKGFDIDLVSAIAKVTHVPIIASGGLGVSSHAADLLSQARCDAIALADFLHMKRGQGINEIKALLSQAGYFLRGR
jgi:cyclase